MRYFQGMADITSTRNEKVRLVAKLRERKHRTREGLFVVEGRREYSRAISNGWSPTLTLIDTNGGVADRELEGPVLSVTPEVLSSVSYRSKSQGLIGVFEQRNRQLTELRFSAEPLLLVLEGMEKPGNLGAIVRTAMTTSVEGVLLVDSQVDIFNPNVIRASTGAIFEAPVVMTDWPETLQVVENMNLALRAATPEAQTSLWDLDWTGPTAILIGSEARGLTRQAREVADERFSIPGGAGTVDSLNASIATAVALFEVMRQRRK